MSQTIQRAEQPSALDVRKLVAAFGGRQQLTNKLRNAGSDIANVRVVDGWILRGRIPANRLLEIARVAAAENKPFDILQFQGK